MYIMVDLSDKVEITTAQLVYGPSPLNEQVICTIQVYSNGTMVLAPDFNSSKMAYIVETGTRNNEAYHYYLEHASTNIQMEDLIKERKLFNEVCLRQQTYLSQIVGKDFDTVEFCGKRSALQNEHRPLLATSDIPQTESVRRNRQWKELRIRWSLYLLLFGSTGR